MIASNHALAVLTEDFPGPLTELCEAVGQVEIPDVELIRGGGGEAQSTQRLRRALVEKGWHKRNIEIRKLVDGQERAAVTHEIDHVRADEHGQIALEIEWNNKDPFFDRDLENFQRLHAEGAISAGVIVTRGASLQANLRQIVHDFAVRHRVQGYDDLAMFDVQPTRRQREQVEQRVKAGASFVEAWSTRFVSDKFGASTTHWSKLQARLDRGVGNPCPLLLLGIPSVAVREG